MTLKEHSDEWMNTALKRFEGPLLQYAYKIVGDLHQAHDVVQDTFIRLHSEDRTKVEKSMASWLFAVCRNRALDILRKRSRMEPIDQTQIESFQSNDLHPSIKMERDETNLEVFLLIDKLPPNQKEVMHLKFREDLSYQEISNITKLSVSNIGFLLHTALKTLRGQITTE
jgi:RNA polymerase sigma factor (sigma-70 family)